MGQSKIILEKANERRMQEAERLMNEEQLTNKKMKTVSIKGKDYVEVNERIKHFREKYQGWGLVTAVIELTNTRVVMKAEVIDDKGIARATGTAFEDQGSGHINKTSFVENCETSAIGRALGNFGIGIDTSIASYEEVASALAQTEEKATKEQKSEIVVLLSTTTADESKKQKISDKIEELTYKEASATLIFLTKNQ